MVAAQRSIELVLLASQLGVSTPQTLELAALSSTWTVCLVWRQRLGFFEGGVIVYFVGNFFDTLRLWLACAQSMAVFALDVSMALCSHWHLCCLGTLRAVLGPRWSWASSFACLLRSP